MINAAEVFLWGSRIGIVSFADDAKFANFEYDRNFIDSGIELSPLVMPLSRQVYSFPALNRESFKGLPGLLADSLPDTFGDAIIESWLAGQGRTKDSMTPVERLCYSGQRGMGALEYKPVIGPSDKKDVLIDIDRMVTLASDILTKRSELAIDENDVDYLNLLKFGTSAGGARAKAIVAIDEKTGNICSGQLANMKEHSYWIIKFDEVDGNGDHGEKDSKGYTRVEYAYYLMAKEAKLNMSECRLLEDNGKYHFMTKRFDRKEKTGEKIHMQTLAALAHLDYNMPGSCSYEKASEICWRLGIGDNEICQLYRQMVFNVVAMNHDDHVKNISFLMDKNGIWSLAPSYDICFSYKPDSIWVSRHQMTVNGKSEGITLEDIRRCGKSMGLNNKAIDKTVEEVCAAVERWNEFAQEANVRLEDQESIDGMLKRNKTAIFADR